MATELAGLDAGRVRTLVGLALARLGPRASGAVIGTFLTLLASVRTSSALAITFATSAHRVVAWLVYPLAGRASDQTRSLLGRRAPYMAAGLLVSAAATWALPLSHGYWTLVALVFLARGMALVFSVTNTAVVPEAFGRSRWIRALVVTYLVGALAGLSIRGTVIAHWKVGDPSTWAITFRLAAIYMGVAGVAVLFLVREAPAARRPRRPPGHLGGHVRAVLAAPNAGPLLLALCLGAAAFGAVGRLTPVFYSKVLHSGGSIQASAGLAAGLASAVVGVIGAMALVRVLSRRVILIGAPVVSAALAGAQVGVHTLAQSLVLGVVGAPFITAWLIACVLFVVQLAPAEGGMAERYGVMLLPFSLASMLASYGAATAVDLAHSYRVMWLFPAVLLFATGLAMFRLHIPAGYERVETGRVLGQLAAGLRSQAQRERTSLVSGELSPDDVDAAAVFDLARSVLGNPYEATSPGAPHPS